MEALSPHLSWAELACRDGTPYPAVWHDRAVRVAAVFEDFRAALGGDPIVIASAYRTPAHNRRIGGAPRSQHVQGRALDCHPVAGMFLAEFHVGALACARIDDRIGGIGLYRWGVHLDVRPHTRLVVWNKISAGTALREKRDA